MAFASPWFLYGLFALAIPILIHLFNFRRYRKVWFTNVRFLAEIKQETRKKTQIRQWILLALRMLAIASLVIAFAQPYIPSPKQIRDHSRQQGVSIYIDNSFSMDAVGKEGKLIETAAGKAREIAAAYKPSDRFQLLTNDFEGRHQHLVSREEFLRMLEDLRISPASRKLSEVVSRQQDLLSTLPDHQRNIYLITDFQKSVSDLENIRPDSTASCFILPLEPAAPANLFIDTAWFESAVQQPDQVSRLRVRVRNTGGEKLEKIPVNLYLNNRQKALASMEIDPSSETEAILPFTNNLTGVQSGYLELPDYPVVYDDKCYLSYPLVSSVPILCINEQAGNPYLTALYTQDSAFLFRNALASRLNYSSFHDYSLIILNQLTRISSGLIQELVRFMDHGGNLLVILPPQADLPGYQKLMQETGFPELGPPDTSRLRVSRIRTESEVYTDVFETAASGRVELPENADLPVVHYHYPVLSRQKSRLEPLLLLQNGNILMGTAPSGKGRFYLLTAPLEMTCTNFPGHLLFIPTFYKIALLSLPPSRLYYFTAGEEPIEVRVDSSSAEALFRIRKIDDDIEIIPEMRYTGGRMLLYPHGQIREAGLYLLLQDDQPVATLAFNYPREESDLTYLSADDIREILQKKKFNTLSFLPEKSASLTREISEFERGKPRWKLFVLLTLLFLGAEIAVIRLFPKQ